MSGVECHDTAPEHFRIFPKSGGCKVSWHFHLKKIVVYIKKMSRSQISEKTHPKKQATDQAAKYAMLNPCRESASYVVLNLRPKLVR